MIDTQIAAGLLIGLFFIMIFLKIPITFALCVSSAVTMLYCRVPLMSLVSQYANAINSFTLMAIPFFMLAGALMEESRLTQRLMDFAYSIVGRLHGGLGHVAILVAMIFAAMSGSAVATAAAIGGMLLPQMQRKQ